MSKFVFDKASLTMINELVVDREYCIRPDHIVTNISWKCVREKGFDSISMLESARQLVILCQKTQGWTTFKRKEIQKSYNDYGNIGRYMFNGLLMKQYIIINEAGYYIITKNFVHECNNIMKGLYY